MLAASRTVAAGVVLGRGIAEQLLDGGRGRARGLTARVHNHVSHVLTRMQVSSRTQAALRMRGL